MENTTVVKKTISQSKASAYASCPLKYYFRYVQKIKRPLSANMILGSSVHKGLEENNKYKAVTFNNQSLNKVLEVFEADYEERFTKDEIYFDEGDGKYEMKDDGVNIIKAYFEEYANHMQPDAKMIEAKFEIPFNNVDYSLTGIIDVADTSKSVIDYKTSRRTKNINELASSIQFPIYRLGYKKLSTEYPTSVKVVQLIRLKRSAKVQVDEIPQALMWQPAALAQLLMATQNAIDKSIFYPSNNQRVCSYCDYKDLCRKGDW